MFAIDSRYNAFRRDLSRHMKGGNIGFDLVGLALTGTASVWSKGADELAAGATGLAGARASLNRELYFEKTLPALVSYMDAERLTVRGQILTGLAQPEATYTIEKLFSDLSRYEAAGSLDRAIAQASSDASAQVAEAKRDYSKAIEVCDVDDEVGRARNSLMVQLQNSGGSSAGIAAVARAAQRAGMVDAAPATDEDTFNAQLDAIADHLLNVCRMDELDEFRDAAFTP